VVVGLLVLGSIIYLWKGRSITSPAKVSQSPKADTQAKLLTWNDPAGFTFDYPEGLTIDKHDEDQENYSHIEFTHPDHQGKVIVWAKDLPLNSKGTPVVDSSEWVEGEAEFANANILDTQLGNQPAKKILLAGPPEKLIIGTVYDDVLWFIEGIFTDKDFWANIHETINNGFTFKPLAGEAGFESLSSESAASETVVDEEEVIE
jgi:hypothetical protein